MKRDLNLLMLSGDRDIGRGRLGPFHTTLAGLASHFSRIDVLTPRSPGSSPRVVHGNVFVHPSTGGRKSQPRYIGRKVGDLIRDRPYALLVSHDFGLFYNGIGAQSVKSKFGVPYVSEIHHVPGHPRAANLRERVLKSLTRWYVEWAQSEVQAFRVVNRIEMPALLSSWGVPKDRIITLPSAYLDFDIFFPRQSASRRWDVVYCGRLVPNKGLNLLAQAARIIATIRPQTRFLVIGEGPEESRFKRSLAAAAIQGNFRFVGWLGSQEEVAEAYAESSLLICISYNEGLPRVCLEAMACGTPVVSTPVGMMPEVIQDRVNGRIVSWDVQEIAAAVLDILDDPESGAIMGRLSVEAVKPFGREKTLEGYARAYRDLAARNIKRLAA